MIEKPLTYKKLREMKLEIVGMEILKISEKLGLLKEERIGRNTFTEKYFKKWKIQKTTD